MERMWSDNSHMEEDAGEDKKNTIEINEIQEHTECTECTPDQTNPADQAFKQEVCWIYQKHSRQPPPQFQPCVGGHRP